MRSEKKVALVWYCKTAKGWRRLPVVIGANNRIKHGYVLIDSVLTYVPDGRYELRLYKNRQPVYKPAGTNATDAQAALQREKYLTTAKLAAEAAGAKLAEEPGRLYLRKAARSFEEDARQRGALESAEVNRHVTDEFIAVTGRTFVDEITREDVLRFHKALRDRGCTSRTVSNKHKRLRSFLIFCKLDHTSILPPTPKYDVTLPDTYSMQEIGRLLKAADAYMTLAVELGLKCGLREQEIMHLEWGDIRWPDATLRVISKPRWNFKVKDAEEREIPIPAPLLARLREHREKEPGSRLVLPTKRGNPNGKLLRLLKRIARAEGLNCNTCGGCKSAHQECQQWTLHKLRRTYCTTLLRSGLDLATVQRFMGHSDLASTMRYLQPATSAASQVAINAINWG